MSNSKGGLAPPPGVIPNFEHPEDVLRTVNLVTQALSISIVSAFVMLRIFARYRVSHSYGPDDYACLIAWVLFLGYCSCGIVLSHYGGGYHQWEVREDHVESFLLTAYVSTIFYAPMAFFVKVALLFILIRVFAPYKKTIKLIYLLLGLLLAYYIPALIIKIRICMPISTYWRRDGRGTCLNQGAVITSDSIMSVISDLAILIMPFPLTWSLQMPIRKKLRVMGILGAGGLATAFSIYRLWMIVVSGASPDQTIIFIRVILSGNAEAGIGIICACLPAMSALIMSTGPEHSSRRRDQSGIDQESSKLRSFTKSGGRPQSDDRKLDPDEAYLVTHAQGEPEIETSIKGDADSSSQRQMYPFDANGIMKTVDVSHTVVFSK